LQSNYEAAVDVTETAPRGAPTGFESSEELFGLESVRSDIGLIVAQALEACQRFGQIGSAECARARRGDGPGSKMNVARSNLEKVSRRYYPRITAPTISHLLPSPALREKKARVETVIAETHSPRASPKNFSNPAQSESWSSR